MIKLKRNDLVEITTVSPSGRTGVYYGRVTDAPSREGVAITENDYFRGSSRRSLNLMKYPEAKGAFLTGYGLPSGLRVTKYRVVARADDKGRVRMLSSDFEAVDGYVVPKTSAGSSKKRTAKRNPAGSRDIPFLLTGAEPDATPRRESRAAPSRPVARADRPRAVAPQARGSSSPKTSRAQASRGLQGLSEFQRGYLAGYDDGLSKCGPLAGLTGFFQRRRERAKIKRRHDEEALEAMRQEIARLEGQRKEGRRALDNPSDIASAAIGGGLGGLALGPVGAAAGAASGVYLKDRFDRGAKKTKKNPMKLYGVIGDLNPIDYGGGVVFEIDDGPHVIYFKEWGDEDTVGTFTVPIEDNLVDDTPWWDWDDVARSTGIEASELQKAGASKDPIARAQVLETLASYYGWSAFDHAPEVLSREEAEERYGPMVDAAHAAFRARQQRSSKKKSAKKKAKKAAKGTKKPRI